MNVQLDLILPPIVLGILLMLIVSLNRMMMESQTGNRLYHEMQLFANTALLVLQEELRDVNEVVTINDSSLVYLTPNLDTVSIRRDHRDLLLIYNDAAGGLADTSRISARLANLTFNQFLLNGTGPMMLRVRVETESSVDQEIGGTLVRYRAFAERDFYLRNLDLAP
jgi:hypothetical protein